MKIADNYGNIAATLKQIEADKVKMLKGKPAEELSILEAVERDKAAKPVVIDGSWGTMGYISIDFDPA